MLITVAARPAAAQCDSCRILRVFEDSSFTIELNGRRYRAFTEEQQRDFLGCDQELQRVERIVQFKDSLLTDNDRLLEAYDSTLVHQREYTARLDSLHRGYKDLAAGYRRLSGDPILSIQLGAGVTGSNTEPALVAGVGILRFRLWGFFQESNAGVLAGVNWRLF
jgi:hypothetical protein